MQRHAFQALLVAAGVYQTRMHAWEGTCMYTIISIFNIYIEHTFISHVNTAIQHGGTQNIRHYRHA